MGNFRRRAIQLQIHALSFLEMFCRSNLNDKRAPQRRLKCPDRTSLEGSSAFTTPRLGNPEWRIIDVSASACAPSSPAVIREVQRGLVEDDTNFHSKLPSQNARSRPQKTPREAYTNSERKFHGALPPPSPPPPRDIVPLTSSFASIDDANTPSQSTRSPRNRYCRFLRHANSPSAVYAPVQSSSENDAINAGETWDESTCRRVGASCSDRSSRKTTLIKASLGLAAGLAVMQEAVMYSGGGAGSGRPKVRKKDGPLGRGVN